MNITMVNVVFIDQRGKMRPLDNFFVLARNVKYIHIPKEVKLQFGLICYNLAMVIRINIFKHSQVND